VWLAVALAGCGDDGGLPPDGGRDATAADAGGGPAAPPAPPAFGPCPDGWTESSVGGVATCEPFPGGEPADCAIHEAHFPGTPGCATIGEPCPAGDYADGLPAAGVLHVRAGASGGDGSASRPYGRIADAVARAGVGTIIALARGRYDEAIRPRSGVTLWGACVAETILTSSVEQTAEGVVTPQGSDVVVRNVQFASARRPAAFVPAGTSLTLEAVAVEDVEFVALVVYGAGLLVARDIKVRATRSRMSNQNGGSPLVVLDGAAEVRRAAFERNRDIGVIVDGPGATLVLEDAVVRDQLPRDTDRQRGRGIEVSEGTATVTRSAILRNLEAGVLVWNGGLLDLTDAVVRDTRVREADSAMGVGITVAYGAGITGGRLLIERNVGSGIITTEGGSFVLQDVVVNDTLPDPDGLYGRAVEVQYASSSELRRAALIGNRDVAVFIGGAGATVRMEDLLVQGTLPSEADLTRGRGLEVIMEAVVDVVRARFEANRDLSVSAFMPGALLRLEDVEVRNTLPRDCVPAGCTPNGSDVGAFMAAAIQANRFLVAGASLCGVMVARDGQLDLRDGVVTGNPIGACVQIDGYDLGRLQGGVDYVDNDSDLQATMLPVPDPTLPGAVAPGM
jgi:hypothetical protein